jgi:nitrogen fixation NifU-like protein
MMLGIDGDTVREVAFTGRGCAISQASASLLTDRIKGKPLAEVADISNADVIDELGIEISPARLKCALLSLDTLQKALAGRIAWTADAGSDATFADDLVGGGA